MNKIAKKALWTAAFVASPIVAAPIALAVAHKNKVKKAEAEGLEAGRNEGFKEGIQAATDLVASQTAAYQAAHPQDGQDFE